MGAVSTLADLYTAINVSPSTSAGGDYWPLDEASGTRASFINAQTLTDNNTVGSATGFLYALAADFEASNFESLTRASSTVTQVSDCDFMMEVWVKMESLVVDRCFGKWVGGSTEEYLLVIDGSGNAVFRVGGILNSVQWSAGLSTGVLYCIHCRHDATGNVIGIAVNAGTEVTASYSGGATAGTSDLSISDATFPVDGVVGPFFLVKGVFADATLRTALYNAGAGVPYASWSGGGGTAVPVFMHNLVQQGIA